MNDHQQTWDERWMGLAQHYASFSKDRRRRVGCVIVDDRNNQVSQGWNGFPRGVDDNIDSRHEKPTKYLFTKHAEENAFLNAAANGLSTRGCILYVPWFPCANCAGDIIQAGIAEVVCYDWDRDDPQWACSMEHAMSMLSEAGVRVRTIAGQPPQSLAA